MGPYCTYCNHRCFTYLDITDLPAEMVAAYKKHRVDIIATCPKGQEAEKQRIGYCYADIQAARAQAEAAERYWQESEQHGERSEAALKGWKTRRAHYEQQVMREKEQGQ